VEDWVLEFILIIVTMTQDIEREQIANLCKQHLNWTPRRIETATLATLRKQLQQIGVEPDRQTKKNVDESSTETKEDRQTPSPSSKIPNGNAPSKHSALVNYISNLDNKIQNESNQLLTNSSIALSTPVNNSIGFELASTLPSLAETLPDEIALLRTRLIAQRSMLSSLKNDRDFDEQDALLFQTSCKRTEFELQGQVENLRLVRDDFKAHTIRRNTKIEEMRSHVDDEVLRTWRTRQETQRNQLRALTALVEEYS
jgi:hypothetical protein